MTYTGKMFEEDFKKGADLCQKSARFSRLYDTTNGFRGVANPCDFIAATRHGTVYVELKTTQSSSLPFSNISEHQWQELFLADQCKYALGGVLVYFPKHAMIKWYPMTDLTRLKHQGKKSINPSVDTEIGYSVDYTKKRTRLTIPIENVLQAFKEHLDDKTYGTS